MTLENVAKIIANKNVSTAIGLLNCAVTNAISIYNIERTKGNVRPNFPNPLSHQTSETQIIELNSCMKLKTKNE